MKQIVRGFLKDESGQDLIEYALVAAIIALGAVVAMSTLASNIATEFNNVGSSV
jgi:pilus assembly protein Flp/PilA